MTSKHFLPGFVTLIAIPCWAAGADWLPPAPVPETQQDSEEPPVLLPEEPFDWNQLDLEQRYRPAIRSDVVARFGWWATSIDGDRVKIGEWQDLSPSPFWDIDGLQSDGFSTVDFFAAGLDQEANQAGLYYYRPGFSADVEYDRYLRRRDHVPLRNFGAPGSGLPAVAEDLNVGEDYAIRVQEFEAGFKGCLTQNIRWRLNLWGMRKNGERQLSSPAHCQDGSQCHVLGQRQRIDWLTMEIEPVLEGRWGPLTLEYSRPMRAFTQDDQLAVRSYNHFGVFDEAGGPFANVPVGVGIVPDNFTQIDQLKIGWDLTPCTNAYALLYNGNTENQLREMNRHFYGCDLRLTNRTIDRLTLTGYFKKAVELNQTPPFFLRDQGEPVVDPASIGVTEDELLGGIRFSDTRHPVDYDRNKVGVKARWKPFPDSGWSRGVALTGGYEYYEIERSYVLYVIGDSDFPARAPLANRLAAGQSRLFELPDTQGHLIRVGTEKRWSPCFDTYVRYTMRVVNDPLMGLRLSDEHYVNTGDPSFMTNSNQPEHEDLIQVGGTWTPVYNFLLTGWIGLENRHSSGFANFDEDSYPIVLTAWYAPTPCWSLSGGAGFYSNWIDQDITVGFREVGDRFAAFTEEWNYTGRAQVYSIGTSYAWTPTTILKGDVEWVRGKNQFFAPSPAGTDLTLLPFFSDVIVETTRLSAGVDWLLTDRISTYFRYVYFDYDDRSVGFNSGTSHMLLGGLAAAF